MPSVQEGLGGGRCVVPSRHGQKGGRWRGSGNGNHGCWLLLQRDDGGHVVLRDAEPLRQGREGAGRGIAEGAQRREEGGQEGMNPLIGFALPYTYCMSRRNFLGGRHLRVR